ncbi:MAG: hypothetical protein ACRESK_10065 [Gammaproteobacteria bacterium]
MRVCGILLLLCIAFPVFATDKSGNYAIWGVGSSSCIKYTTMRAANDVNDYRKYIMGYLTAYNHLAEDTYSISGAMTMDEVLSWLDDQCELKPTSSFDQAIIEFVISQHDKRSKYPPGGFGR